MKNWLRVGALIVGLVLIFFFKQKLSQSDALSPILPPESFVATTTMPGTGVAAGGSAAGQLSGATPAADTFAASLKECSGGQLNAVSPKELVQQLEQNLKSKEPVVENWHLMTPEGREERIMIITSDRENAGGRKEVRWFDVDAEGLPIPKKLPVENSLDPKPEFLESLKSRGKVSFHQTKELLRFNDGASANVEWINDDIHDMQIYLAGKTLSCRGLDCQCK